MNFSCLTGRCSILSRGQKLHELTVVLINARVYLLQSRLLNIELKQFKIRMLVECEWVSGTFLRCEEERERGGGGWGGGGVRGVGEIACPEGKRTNAESARAISGGWNQDKSVSGILEPGSENVRKNSGSMTSCFAIALKCAERQEPPRTWPEPEVYRTGWGKSRLPCPSPITRFPPLPHSQLHRSAS